MCSRTEVVGSCRGRRDTLDRQKPVLTVVTAFSRRRLDGDVPIKALAIVPLAWSG